MPNASKSTQSQETCQLCEAHCENHDDSTGSSHNNRLFPLNISSFNSLNFNRCNSIFAHLLAQRGAVGDDLRLSHPGREIYLKIPLLELRSLNYQPLV